MTLNPDWSKLKACRESLREHMKMCERLKDQRNRIKTQTEQPLLVELNRLRALNAELEREVIRLRSDLDGMTAAAESLQFDVYGVMDSTE